MPYADPAKKQAWTVRWRAALIAGHRAAMAARQAGLCEWCGKPLADPIDGDRTHIDHVTPIRDGRGGAIRRSHYDTHRAWAVHGDGLRLLHADCNMDRSDGPRFPFGDDEHGRILPA